jgi:hypothetical protein
MTLRRRSMLMAITLACVTLALARSPEPARAFNPIGTACSVAGWFSGIAGKACNAGNKLLGVGKKLLRGSAGGGASKVQAAIGLAAIGAWVMGGAKVAMEETAKVMGHSTTPRLTTAWFSSTYWRMAAVAAVLTLPFLFAAAVQALTRSDLALLMRAAFGYLPLALLAVGIAAPLTMLLLAATDQMCSAVSAASGNAGPRFLTRAGVLAGAVSIFDGSAFLAFLIGLFVALGALVLWLELLLREAAVYVIVLMLPLAFAAFVWPARRVWAIRALELLVALILSKFAIVAVLTLGGSALGQSPFSGTTSMLVGLVLVTLGAMAPWAMLRLVPLAEMASGAVSAMHGESWRLRGAVAVADTSARVLTAAGQPSEPQEGQADTAQELRPERAARAETERLAGLKPMPIPAVAGANGHGGEAEGSEEEENNERFDDEPAGEPRATAAGGSTPPRDLFDAEDWGWRPIRLGLGEGWPPPPPASLGPAERSGPSGTKPPGPDGGGEPAPASPSDAGPAEDHDPLPPEQEPEDGRL